MLHTFLASSVQTTKADGPLRESVPHIVTTEVARLDVVPDQADIRLGITHESPTADDATSVTVKAATDVIEAIKTRGIETRNIKTSFSVSAKYDSILDPKTNIRNQVFRGYIAEEAIVVHITDVSKAGSIARELIRRVQTPLNASIRAIRTSKKPAASLTATQSAMHAMSQRPILMLSTSLWAGFCRSVARSRARAVSLIYRADQTSLDCIWLFPQNLACKL